MVEGIEFVGHCGLQLSEFGLIRLRTEAKFDVDIPIDKGELESRTNGRDDKNNLNARRITIRARLKGSQPFNTSLMSKLPYLS